MNQDAVVALFYAIIDCRPLLSWIINNDSVTYTCGNDNVITVKLI